MVLDGRFEDIAYILLKIAMEIHDKLALMAGKTPQV